MNSGVVPLDELRAGDVASAGGKAAKLGELAGKGFPVPPGFVVPAGACRSFFESLGLASEMGSLEDARPSELAQRSQILHGRIVRAELPKLLAGAILEAHARLIGNRDVVCAVRSSATAEDLADASFAGQHGTYYYVDAAHLLEMVRRCWGSLFSAEAASYRSTHGIPHASVSMAVVVQEMVASEVSGVAFTANPVSGDTGEIVVEASWGMGAAIVDGRVTPDRYVVARSGLGLRERRIADKRLMVPTRLDDESAERLVPVPHELRRREALQPAQLQTVVAWSLRCEEHFGAPQDVEWAFANGRFHLLQSRPITTLGRAVFGRGVKGRHVLFKALAENFTEPLTPLSEDLMSQSLPPGMTFVGGRVYMDLALMRRLLPFALSDEELAELLYSIGSKPIPVRLSLARLPLAALLALGSYLVLAVVLARTRDLPDSFMDSYRGLCRKVEADPSLDATGALRRLWLLPRILDPVGRMPVFVNITSVFRLGSWMVLLARLLKRWAPGLGPGAVPLLCSGSDGVLSAEMGRAIGTLADVASRESVVRETLIHNEPAVALARLRDEPAARSFIEGLGNFLAVHGHRGVREFELRSARWEEDPTPVLGMIRNYCAEPQARQIEAGEDSPVASDAEKKAVAARFALAEQVRGALGRRPLESLLGLRWRLVQFAAKRARYYIKLRENSRFYHIMGLGSVRKKILGIERELRSRGRLKCKDDIFFLREREVGALRAGRLGWLDVEDRIRERRIEHVRLSKATAPRTLGIECRARAPVDAGDTERLSGQSASPGRYTGIARVILDPSTDVALGRGEVLVAPYTDPAWTPLFLTAGAAVVEVGSFLSHAGTVAREFGMPCVVDVEDCTRRIQPGDLLEVDGSSGVVRILRRGGRP
jgi:pyruvate,water dikinase